jgi:hypothetical protein
MIPAINIYDFKMYTNRVKSKGEKIKHRCYILNLYPNNILT